MGSRRILIALATATAITVSSAMVPVSAQARSSYEIVVTAKAPVVKYFDRFAYDSLVVTGPDGSMARKLTGKVRAFSLPWVDEFRKPDAKTARYLKRAQPAGFSARATPTAGCHRTYICLSQETVFTTPLIAGSVTDVVAGAWSTKTGKPALLEDFVPPRELPAFTAKVKAAIRKAPCYYGFEIDLEPDYASYPNWVPLAKGIAVWFPEYLYGCQIMTLRVAWP